MSDHFLTFWFQKDYWKFSLILKINFLPFHRRLVFMSTLSIILNFTVQWKFGLNSEATVQLEFVFSWVWWRELGERGGHERKWQFETRVSPQTVVCGINNISKTFYRKQFPLCAFWGTPHHCTCTATGRDAKKHLFSKILVLCSRESRRQPNAASTTSWDIWTGKTIHCLNGDDTAVWFDLSILQSFLRQVLIFKKLTSWWLNEKHIGHFVFCFFHLMESGGFKKQWKMKLFISCPRGQLVPIIAIIEEGIWSK